jgi:hypothetical protein
MLKMPPKHASISTALRLADLRLPATGFAEIRWHAMQVIEMQQGSTSERPRERTAASLPSCLDNPRW